MTEVTVTEPSPSTSAKRRHRRDTEVSVVIPTLNEAGNVEMLLNGLRSTFRALGTDYEIIVVDAGSTDATVEKTQALGVRVHRQQRPGYGSALIEGMRLACGRYVLTMDADLSHNPNVVRRLYRNRKRADILIASRYVRGGYAHMPLSRRLLSAVLNRAYARVLDLPVRDLSSGFRLYRRAVLKDLQLEQQDFSLLEEVLVKAYAEGYSVEEIPFHYHPRKSGTSKAKVVAFGISYSKLLLRLWRLRNSISSADYDERAFYSWILPQRLWQRRRYHLITGLLEPSGEILDVGCGSSKILESIPAGVGLDVSMRKLRYRRALGNDLVAATLFALPFRSKSFDQLICSQVIEHVPRDEVFLHEFHRVLKPGGILIVGTPDYARLSWRIIEKLYGILMPGAYADEHITHYTFAGLRSLLEENGFDYVDHGYVYGSELVIKARKR